MCDVKDCEHPTTSTHNEITHSHAKLEFLNCEWGKEDETQVCMPPFSSLLVRTLCCAKLYSCCRSGFPHIPVPSSATLATNSRFSHPPLSYYGLVCLCKVPCLFLLIHNVEKWTATSMRLH